MQTIRLETRIAAPALRVFLLSLSVDLHKASTKATGEEAIAGVSSGTMDLNDSVTWRARHFGLMLRHTSKITAYDAPRMFVDSMTQGAFHSFEHLHEFTQLNSNVTTMKDELVFASPVGPLGALVDRLVLKRYLTGFLMKRNQLIREVAESGVEGFCVTCPVT